MPIMGALTASLTGNLIGALIQTVLGESVVSGSVDSRQSSEQLVTFCYDSYHIHIQGLKWLGFSFSAKSKCNYIWSNLNMV